MQDPETTLERVFVTALAATVCGALAMSLAFHEPQRAASATSNADDISQMEIDIMTGRFDDGSLGRDFDY